MQLEFYTPRFVYGAMNQHFQVKVSNNMAVELSQELTAPSFEFSHLRGNSQLCKIPDLSGMMPFGILDAGRFLWAGVRLSWVDLFQLGLASVPAESF